MSLRVSRYYELCKVCGERTQQACFRCKAPLCQEHAPKAKKRCRSCEREFGSWPSREPTVVFIGLGLASIWFAGTLALLDVSPVAAVVFALLFPVPVSVAAMRRLKSGRQLFLAEEKRPAALADNRRLLL